MPNQEANTQEMNTGDATEAAPQTQPRTARKFPWLAALLVASLLANVALFAWLKGRTAGTATPTATATQPAAQPATQAAPEAGKAEPPATATDQVELSAEAIRRGQIETGEAALRPLPQTLEAPGRLTVNEDAAARIGSMVEGRVARVLVKVGDAVRAGQPVVYVHSHEVAEARADYAKAQAGVVRGEQAVGTAHNELARADRLLAAKAISERERQQAAFQVSVAQAELDTARAERRRAEEFLRHLGATADGADEAVIRAPASGTVMQRLVSVGTVVSPATDLLTVANLSSLWAIAEVPEKMAAALGTGEAVEISVAALPQSRFVGRVIYINETINPATRTAQVRCALPNPRGLLRPEMTATVRITVGNAAPALAVPREAVQEVNGERVVFVRTSDTTFEKRPVQTGREQGGYVEITGGLKEGERVVTRGGFFIKSALLKGTLEEE
jgi:membrane fusion protein, heavy metal efflux system